MLFGVAKEIITPVNPTRIACCGGYRDVYHTIHDDVYVRTLVLEEGGKKVAFMVFDILFHDRSLNDALEAYAQSAYGIEPGGLLITYTHAHTSPVTRGYCRGVEDDAYELFLVERAKCCLDRAMGVMVPGTLELGTFDADFNISRRGIVNGKYDIHPNFNYEHDTEFVVLCVRDEEEQLRSVFMNYACHPVFYPATGVMSGEFPARVCQYLDTAFYGCVSMFSQSDGGDVRPRPTVVQDENGDYVFNSRDFATVDAFAADISKAVAEFIRNGGCKKVELDQPWACAAFTMELPMEPAPFEYFQKMAEVFQNDEGIFKRNTTYIVNGGYEEMSDILPVRSQIVRLSSDLYIATMGGEPCYGVKKAVLAAFGGHKVIFIGYTDDCAYLVDDVLLEEGGYEPSAYLEYCLKGPLKAGVTELYTKYYAQARAALPEKDSR